MGKTYVEPHEDDPKKKDIHQRSCRSTGSEDGHRLGISELKSWPLVKSAKRRTLILKLIQLDSHEGWFQELFHKRSCRLGNKIPRPLISIDEKYLRQCLELVHMIASKAAPCSISGNLSSLDMGFTLNSAASMENVMSNSVDLGKYCVDYPMAFGPGVENLIISPVGRGFIGSIMGSNSMMRILKSPLLQSLSSLDDKRRIRGALSGLLSESSRSSSMTTRNEKTGSRNCKHTYDAMRRSSVSLSSEQSLLTDHLPSPFSHSDSQGMLQFTWHDGFPHLTFSVDDEKQIYVATACKPELPDNKALDYVYSFHEHSDNNSVLVGKMKVCTSFALCSNNLKVTETKFVLFGMNEDHENETNTMKQSMRKSRRLSRVMEVFKPGNAFKQRSLSIFSGTSAVPKNYSPEKDQETSISRDPPGQLNQGVSHFLPNLELAAIIVKDSVYDDNKQKEDVGGWGLKFLKKAEAASELCQRNFGDCSTSMDIILPAGPHGGPSTRDGGPSGLIERWRSGGRCDCGGWDIGCPITVLKAEARKEEGSSHSAVQGDRKAFDIFTEGSRQEMPKMKMVKINEGLYSVNFQSCLSCLQCLSIAVAIIHSQAPNLSPKPVQE